MDNNISEIEDLIKQFSKLPGLGPKSAKRIILKLINNKDNMIKPLAKSLAGVYKKVVRCSNCGNLKIIDKTCLCETDTNYDKICIVENLADMWVIDSANIYKGHYHILGGTINSQYRDHKSGTDWDLAPPRRWPVHAGRNALGDAASGRPCSRKSQPV